MIAFTVHGAPQAWQRAGQSGSRRFKTAPQRAYQRLVQYSILRDTTAAQRAVFLELATRVSAAMVAYVPRSNRADLDNIQKQIGDAAQTVLLANDRQIVEWHARRVTVDAYERVEVVFGVAGGVAWDRERMMALVGGRS